MKRLPVPLVAALFAVLLTATAVFAARPEMLGAPRPAAPSPVVVVPDETDPPSATAAASERAEASESAEAAESAEPSDADSEAADGSPQAHPSNHGLDASTAAQASTPAGCRNHGEYVSLVARGIIAPNATPQSGQTSVCDANPKHASDAPDAGSGQGKGARHASANGQASGKGHAKP